MKGEKRSAARLKARSSRWRRSRERAPPAAGTYIWEIVHALGEGGESAEPGGGSARPSHGAGVADSPLTSLARDVAPWLGASTKRATVARCSSRQIAIRCSLLVDLPGQT